jgi:hypothetical protein
MRSAPAQVAGQRALGIVARRMRLSVEQRDGAHDHAGNAVPALRRLLRDERDLHRMRQVAGADALDRRDRLPCDAADLDAAGARGFAVDQHGARPALPDAAAVLGAGEAKTIAQHEQQRLGAVAHVQRARAAVHVQGHGWHGTSSGYAPLTNVRCLWCTWRVRQRAATVSALFIADGRKNMIMRLIAALVAGTALTVHVAHAQSPVDTLAKIKAAKAINVAYSPDSLPFSMKGAGAEPTGYSIDLCKRVIAQIGQTVGDPTLKVNWMPGTVSERLQMVAAGRADLECANTTQTQTRLANVDFSNLIFIDGGGFVVQAGAPINEMGDLAGKKVAVLKGTTTEGRLNDALRRRLISASVVPINDPAEGMTMLEAAASTPTPATRSS